MKPTPCKHKWRYDIQEYEKICRKCHVDFQDLAKKPTPEEKLKWVTIIDVFGTELQGWLKPSPSPEARVDWEVEARDLSLWIMRVIFPRTDKTPADYPDKLVVKEVAKALSAAFEKGREAR